LVFAMFTIDLLKGQGVPIRSGPEGIVVVAVTLVVPVVVAIVMLGCYLRSSIVMSIQKQDILNYETKIEELVDAVQLQKSFEQEKSQINNCLSEVASSIGNHTQWSPIVAEVVKNMPDSMCMTKLRIERRFVKKQVPSKDNPLNMVEITVPARTLQIGVCALLHSDSSVAIRDFRDSLRASPLLQPELENIRVSQKAGKLDDKDVVSYEINCDFKEGL